jgi:hypothetical protein
MIAIGDRWRHKRSNRVRTVLAITTGGPPYGFYKMFGATHIAVMGTDCTDSSDMVLWNGVPSSDWERIT